MTLHGLPLRLVRRFSISTTVLDPKLRHLLHQLNNRLNAGGIGLALLRRQLELNRTNEMARTLDRIEEEFQALKQCFETSTQKEEFQSRKIANRQALIVEDDVNECELLAGFLRLAGLKVNTAHDGADALDYLRQNNRPDVLLLDMILPHTDGPSTVRAIRSNPACAGIKIVGMSGADPQRFNLPIGSNGVDHWFHKPLNPQTLLDELSRLIE